MVDPTVSVVVPSLNRASVIRQTLDSILAQDHASIECIVMDGGSSDGTLDILRTYGDRIQWVSEADQGQADAIDRGLRRSRGQICGWLNADDIWCAPTVVSKVVAAFESDDAADVIYGDCASIASDGSHIGKSYVVPDWTLRYSVEHADHCIAQPASFTRKSSWTGISGCGSAWTARSNICRSAWRPLGTASITGIGNMPRRRPNGWKRSLVRSTIRACPKTSGAIATRLCATPICAECVTAGPAGADWRKRF